MRDDRHNGGAYVALRRDCVHIGVLQAWEDTDRARRLPPHGVELVLETDDLDAERQAVLDAGWPLFEDVTDRPWGLRDFRLLDPDGHFLRFTTRA